MTNTREKILQTLLAQQRCTINELADAVAINPISVRHHIMKLEAEGLVTTEEERHGVGRPRRLYFLTETGLERFPTRYLNLTNQIIDQLKDSLTDQQIKTIFTQVGEKLAARFHQDNDIEKLSLEERLVRLKSLLAQEGFNVDWEQEEEHYVIREMNCPYYHIGQSHPEVCAVDKTLISSVLAIPAEKVKCILNGDNFCTYVVPRTNISLQDIEIKS